MDFSVLGPVRAFIDGRPVDLGVRKQRFVLAVLLLEANKHVTADRLIELAWPEGEAPDTARAVIHTQISRLRTIFAGSEDALSSVATEDIRLRVAAPLEEARLGAWRTGSRRTSGSATPPPRSPNRSQS